MGLFLILQAMLLLLNWMCFSVATPLTVIMSDSSDPSALVDAPQTGFSMNKNGARTDAKEQDAVYAVMAATGNEWAADIPDVCRGRWHGIECMPDQDNVYHVVSLSFGSLSDDTAFPTCDQSHAFISPALTKLPHIRSLFFYRCFGQNAQPIPTFLGQLGSSLQTLVLRENGHVGPIPVELGNLTRLKVLDLHKNNLNGSIPDSLSRLTGLRSLDLSGNRLTGLIPRLILKGLNVLDLSQNLLMGRIPESLGSCHCLIKLDLGHNRLSGPLPDSIGDLKDLILMDLSYNHLTGPLPTSFRSLGSLQVLILKENQMGLDILPSFDGLKSLMILVLSSMNLHGPIPESLGRLPNLRVLHLDRNHLNGSIPRIFWNLKNLSELRLNDNQLNGHVSFQRDLIWRMRKKLRLYNNLGLCYDATNISEDGLGSSFDLGITYCDTSNLGLGTTTQHLSKFSKDMLRSTSTASAEFRKRSILIVMLVHATLITFFTLSKW